ncbi:MAG: carboxypeptidase-like regulatory domain-containing protein [Bacteroides sp.]|nr:carboxypeptidase-like regulatory domain-containing protein [Bacteroides sp.]
MRASCLKRLLVLAALWLLAEGPSAYSQLRHHAAPAKIIQFSGVVVSGIDSNPLPFTTLIIGSRRQGTIADANGFFSFVALVGDTVRFTSVGYRPRSVVIPDTIRHDAYSMMVPMEQDTVMLLETVIYPWPSKDKFREAFINLKLPQSDMDIIRKNFDLASMREQARNGKMSADMNYRSLMQQQVSRNYYQNQVAPVNLLNPFAWAQFVKQLKRRKDMEKTEAQGQDYKQYEATPSGALPEFSNEE